MKPPVAKRVPTVRTLHGKRVEDAYRWLERRNDPEVVAYLEAENAYAEAVMGPTADLQRELYDEILGRIKETDRSVPERDGPFAYYRRTVRGQPYAIHCRTAAGSDEEQVLLDENELARERDYFRLGVFEVSPDHSLLAYSFDDTGDERFRLRFVDLASGRRLDDEILDTHASVEWAADGRTVFYTRMDDAQRPDRLMRHRLGDDPSDAAVVYREEDESYFLSVHRTKDRRYLLMVLESNTTSEVHFLDATRADGSFRVVEPRRHRVEYAVEHHGDRFLILTNDDAVNFKLMEVPVADPGKRGWKELLPHRAGVKLDGLDVFRGHLAVAEREEGLRGIRVLDLGTSEQHKIDFPESVYSVWLCGNPEFDTHTLRFGYTSLVTPDSAFDYDMRTRRRELLKQREVVGGYESDDYRAERLYATAADGARVPVSLVYRRREAPAGPRPLLLYGYGSYGISVDPEFDSGRLSLLDRGVVFAVAHVRGGGDLGRPWYDAGKLEFKTNTFTDFVACSEYLIAAGYTAPDRLAIRGGSAGGLLVGAVLNMRPELFSAAVAKVPFVDVVNTMLDPSIPLTVTEREEWGDPRQPADYERMMAYSPYDNVAARDYPDLLIMAGLNDPRVAYWEPAKWAARLRSIKSGSNLLLLRTNMSAGHAGASGRYESIRELALEYAFILGRLVPPPRPSSAEGPVSGGEK